ncbi:MAG TPA: DUF1684 domain-containing protein [Rhodocyclaceae bacterium]
MNSLEQDHAAWRARRLAALTAEDGWLTVIGLEWLEDGDYSVGSAGAIQLEAAPPLLGVLRAIGGTVEWRPVDGPAQRLASDADGAPTVVHHGRYRLFVIERDGRLALRIKDAEAPARRDFKGIEYFPFDPAWILAARWDGALAHFDYQGQAHTLRPQRAGERPLQFVIGDRSSGRETYGGGRFLFATPEADGALTLDFNRAINPPCVFTLYATCPLPAAENRLPFAVTAGERSDGH